MKREDFLGTREANEEHSIDESTKVPSEVDKISELIGEFTKYFGFKKIHGQIWCHIFLSPAPLDAGTLIRRLGISKALASMSLADLCKYRVILKQGMSDFGTITYSINPDLVEVITDVLKNREMLLLDQIKDNWTQLSAASDEGSLSEEFPIDHTKIELLGDLIDTAKSHLNLMVRLSSLDLSVWKKFSDLNRGL